MVGQAKHYQAMQSGTPDIRAVVGSIDLARGKAFGSASDKYPDLYIRVYDPVFYLFFRPGTSVPTAGGCSIRAASSGSTA
jgi:hypothetical protein